MASSANTCLLACMAQRARDLDIEKAADETKDESPPKKTKGDEDAPQMKTDAVPDANPTDSNEDAFNGAVKAVVDETADDVEAPADKAVSEPEGEPVEPAQATEEISEA